MPKTDWKTAYPYESHWSHCGDYRYHFVDEGQGEPLLMVHGNPTWSFYWRRLIDSFSSEFRCVAPDHLGCGLSDKPADYGYQLQTHIDNLVRLIDELDLRNVTLLGHDWGGAIGLGAAQARPDRFKQFVLFNTGAFPPPYIPLRIRVCRFPVVGRYALQGLNLFSQAAVRMAVADQSKLSATAREGLLAPYDSWEHRVAVYGFVKDIPASPKHPTWATLDRIEQQLASLADRRVLLIWGMRDWCFTPECLRRFQQHFPSAEVLELEDAGHWVVEEASEKIIQRLNEFLAGKSIEVV
ncbi:MAG: alpha/beta fold hydrolase [Pirellulaceae bacterium]|nr:alpha/beta fold hydrolase [Pirellulaceae bacterium]